MVPVLVVNSLLVPSVLFVLSQWSNTDNSSSIWGTCEVKITHSDVSWQHPTFCCICVWNTGPLLGGTTLNVRWSWVGWGGGWGCGSFLSIFLLFLPSFPSFWSNHQIFPGFYEWRLRRRLGKWLAEEDVWENVPEQAITFDNATVPLGQEEESRRAGALLVMKNAVQEGALLWSRPFIPTLSSTVVHQTLFCCCAVLSVFNPQDWFESGEPHCKYTWFHHCQEHSESQWC